MSEKYSKRKMEELLRQTSATLSGEADERIRGKLGIADAAASAKSVRAEDKEVVDFTDTARRNGKRRAVMNFATVMALAAVVCAVLLTVWVHSLRKDPGSDSGEEGQVGTTVTVSPTPTEPTVTVSPTPTEPTPTDVQSIVIGDYTGMTSEQVRDAVENKLAIRIDWADSDVVEENHVIETEPKAGESVPVGSTLTLILSQGSSMIASVPDVVGRREEDAKAILIAAKLNYEIVTTYSDTVPAGMVISQSPDSTIGMVEKGTMIEIIVSLGTEPEVTPTPAIGLDEILIDEKNFPDTVFRETVAENWDTNQNGALDAAEISACTHIIIRSYDGKELRSLEGIGFFTELESLSCYKSDITGLDLSRNLKLYNLDCNDSRLTKLDLSANTNLTVINVSGNELTELDLSSNVKIRRLDCSNNKINSLNLSGNTELTELYCSSNPLNGLDVSNCKKLTRLECFEGGLETIDLSGNTELAILSLGGNKLTVLDLSNNGKLENLECYRNNLESLTFKPGTPLQNISCEDNKLTSLDVSGLAMLEQLNCGINALSEIDISGNPKLRVLLCDRNPIRKLDLSRNSKLEELTCWDCGMSEVIMGSHPALLSINAIGNNFTELDASGCPETADVEVDDGVTVIRTKSEK